MTSHLPAVLRAVRTRDRLHLSWWISEEERREPLCNAFALSSLYRQVLTNVDDLFEREELSAAPDPGWPDCFNSGVFVYRPSVETYRQLLHVASEQGSFDGTYLGSSHAPRCPELQGAALHGDAVAVVLCLCKAALQGTWRASAPCASGNALVRRCVCACVLVLCVRGP